jgi:hypothetical protein
VDGGCACTLTSATSTDAGDDDAMAMRAGARVASSRTDDEGEMRGEISGDDLCMPERGEEAAGVDDMVCAEGDRMRTLEADEIDGILTRWGISIDREGTGGELLWSVPA